MDDVDGGGAQIRAHRRKLLSDIAVFVLTRDVKLQPASHRHLAGILGDAGANPEGLVGV